jgi:hypothetical protein
MQHSKSLNRRIVFMAISFIFALTINAQDIITKRDGTEIKAKVTEVGSRDVKYTRFGTSSPTYTLLKSEILAIKYEDGAKDVFDQQSNTQTGNRNNTSAHGNRGNRQQNEGNTNQQNNRRQNQQVSELENSDKDEQYKKDIVGSFMYVKTEQSDEMSMSIEATETFSETGRLEDSGTMTMIFYDANAGKISLKYKLSLRGRYTIKNSYIIYDYNINSIDIQPIYTASTTEIEKKMYAYLEDQFLSSLKEEIINSDDKDKIIELNENRLVIENSKKEQSIYKRIIRRH